MLWFKVPPKIYFKRGATDLALRELKGRQRAFIVTDRFLFDSRAVDQITRVLEDIGMDFQIFFDVKPDPTLSTINEAMQMVNVYKPDVIIALGGGSPIDAAKVIWLMYEQPETVFDDVAMRFMDIRKRICDVPELGKKALMVAIPTTSGTGSEVQMGYAEGKSMLYLEARCLAITKGAGVQGTQNGSVSCVGVPAGVPGGIRAIAAENLIAMLLDLESTTSNDQTFTHSDLRRVARSVPQFFSGTDYICSGYSATPNYDNMFAGSNWDAEDYDDWNIIQRDMKIDGGLQPVREEDVIKARNKAARALQGLFRELGLPPITDAEVEAATYANGSNDMPDRNVNEDLKAIEDMMARNVTGVDFVKALDKAGFPDVAQNIYNMLRQKVAGDYLHTASIFGDNFHVLSAVNAPNDYHGPMTGYQISEERWKQISDIPNAIRPEDI